ncbi:MAG: hypothetical protein K0R77_1834 [Chryseobacterium sp.]|jgi:hypothetical protein|uniref:bacteriocin-like protein n=1 Tax=Chryseobacterium sp. TaxID=1871047 RepID=UPI0026018745|nr:hypothetical protein [Chryseobacterium sp.]MDF2552559.1 hypothetical protein [Chryseobacterium sp.]
MKNLFTMKNFKKLSRNELKTVTAGQVWIAETKCGFTATTTQDWTSQQATAWMLEIEKNYCKKPTYSGNDIAHLAIN